MNILVTGAKGMVGTALYNNLKNIRNRIALFFEHFHPSVKR